MDQAASYTGRSSLVTMVGAGSAWIFDAAFAQTSNWLSVLAVQEVNLQYLTLQFTDGVQLRRGPKEHGLRKGKTSEVCFPPETVTL